MTFKINDCIDIDVDINGVKKTYKLNYKNKLAYNTMNDYIAKMKEVENIEDKNIIIESILESSKTLINTLLNDNVYEEIFENRLNDLMDLQAFILFIFKQIQEDKEKTLKDYGL